MPKPIFAAAAALIAAPAALAQPADGLAPYFGFEEARFVKVDDGCGPAVVGDFNGDGRPDLAVVNNRKSWIEIHYLRAEKRTVEEQVRSLRVNELPPSPWYDREYVSVAHRVTALVPIDVDGDKKLDLIYAGTPAELVVMRQGEQGKFTVAAKQRVRDLAARQDSLAVADVIGDEAPEVIALAGDRVHIFPLDRAGRMGEPTILGSGDALRQAFVEDFNGDGLLDVLGVVPDDAAPLRLWLQSQDPRRSGVKAGLLAAELRFELPQLREALPIRFPGRAAASIGTIERASQRVVFYDLSSETVGVTPADATVAQREVLAEVTAFADPTSKGRSVAVADLDGDGLADLVANDQKGNAVVYYRQQKNLGLAQGEPFSAFKTPKAIDVGRWAGDDAPRIFVLSDDEKAVGVSTFDREDGRISFPEPLPIATGGASPVAMRYLDVGGRPALAVVVKDRRDYVLEIIQPNGGEKPATIALKDLKRDPGAILSFDADRDGVQDLLLLTPGEAMVMVRCESKGEALTPAQMITKEAMPQFGLVQAAGPDNTALLDADGDGQMELTIADANYVRFCAFDPKKGWRVVDQVNVPDSSTQLAGLAFLGEGENRRIVAADKANGRLLIFGLNDAGRWTLRERVRVLGFPVAAIRAGEFAGDGTPGVLCLSDNAFALVRLGGKRPALEPFAAYRAEAVNRLEHNLAAGDVNSDGYLDVVVLDAREQMCQILTFSASRKVHLATEFKVYESRLFQRGDSRELEPSDALIVDATGDGHSDLILVVHDRVVIYPQAAPK